MATLAREKKGPCSRDIMHVVVLDKLQDINQITYPDSDIRVVHTQH